MTHDVKLAITYDDNNVIREIRRFTNGKEISIYENNRIEYDIYETLGNRTRMEYDVKGLDDIRILVTHIAGKTTSDKLATQMIRIDLSGKNKTVVTCLDNFLSTKDSPADQTADFFESLAVRASFSYRDCFKDCSDSLYYHRLIINKFETRHFTVDPLRGGNIELIGKPHYKEAFTNIVQLKDISEKGMDFSSTFGEDEINPPESPMSSLSSLSPTSDVMMMINEEEAIPEEITSTTSNSTTTMSSGMPSTSGQASSTSLTGDDDLVSKISSRLSNLEKLFSVEEETPVRNKRNAETPSSTTSTNPKVSPAVTVNAPEEEEELVLKSIKMPSQQQTQTHQYHPQHLSQNFTSNKTGDNIFSSLIVFFILCLSLI